MRISEQCKTCKFKARKAVDYPCNCCWTGNNKYQPASCPKGA